MKYSINASITPKGAAKLLLMDEIDLSYSWSKDESISILNALLSLDAKEILSLIDSVAKNRYIDIADIPQFGSIDALIRVPEIILHSGQQNYAQLGFALKNDLNASLYANIKFGENHGKGASLLGLVDCTEGKFVCSALSNAFLSFPDYSEKQNIVIKLYFRIPIIQVLLYKAEAEKINGFSVMSNLSESTRKRRSQCVRGILRCFSTFNCDELNIRLNNIYWD